MKRHPRRFYKPWYKKRKPSGSLGKASTSGQDSQEVNIEIFVGYHVKKEKSQENDDDDEEARTIKYDVEPGCPFQAWKLYFPLKSKKKNYFEFF